MAASLQYISDVRINPITKRSWPFSRTCSLAPDDCRRVAGWQIRVSLGACHARDCTLPMFYVKTNKYNELKKSFVKSIGTVDPTGKEGR